MCHARTLSFTLVAVLGSPFASAGPNIKHTTSEKTHTSVDGVYSWSECTTWAEVKPGAVSPDDPVLTSGWTLSSAADVSANVMFSYVSMDDAMNVVSEYDETDLDFYSIEITRSAGGVPAALSMTIESEVYGGPSGFSRELAAPVSIDMTRTRYVEAATPGLYIAMYEGVRDYASFLVTDPGIDGVARLYETDQAERLEIGILTSVPSPGSLAAALAGVGVIAVRRRRAVRSGR
ncbi:MAG: hypothetical protein AAGI53_09890 [Planctomycetota bacterium]